MVKTRLLKITDPAEVFARFACILLHREILDGNFQISTREKINKVVEGFNYFICDVTKIIHI